MAREWPATTAATLIELIDDPRHKVSSKGTARLSAEQAKAILDLRLQRLTALGREEIKEELDKLAAEIADYLDILRSRVRIQTIIKDELAAVRKQFATPRRSEITEAIGGDGRRGPDPARGHGRHRLASRLHQARAALDLSCAKARRQRPRRHAGARGGFRLAAVRRLDARAAAVLLVARQGLQGKGLAAAALRAAGQGQGADQHPAARSGRDHHHHHAAAGERGGVERHAADVRHHQGHRAQDRARPLRRGAAVGSQGDQAGGGRLHRRRRIVHRQGRHPAHHARRPVHPLPGGEDVAEEGARHHRRFRHQARRRR